MVDPLTSSRTATSVWEADPPQWALDAGLPPPEQGESWLTYLGRLGYERKVIADLFRDLTDQTAPLLKYRFSEVLRREMPAVWDEYVAYRCRDITPQRRAELQGIRWKVMSS